MTGKVIAIEVKRPSTRNNLTEEQRAYLEQVKRAGGLAGVATCYEEAAAIVEGRG
ncbi:MAG: VRR-NUC domain-containing protein [Candidatus Accumulibacter sp.]|nr:VRR-NUC domain-containing protein [Accumulibacter sp.]